MMTGCNVVMLLNAANNTAAAAPQYLARSHDSCFFNLESFFTPSLFPISYLLNVCFDVLPAFRSVVSMPPKRSSPKGRPNRAKFKCIRCDKVVNGDQRDIHRNKIHGGDPSVQYEIYCGDNKQPKLSFSKVPTAAAPPSDDSSSIDADRNGNLVTPSPAPAATNPDESAPLDPASQDHGETAPPLTTATVPASNLHRVTAANDPNFQTLNEAIKLSSRGYNNDVTIVCSDGCFESSRVILAAIFPTFKKLFGNDQSYKEDSIISMPDFSSFEINALFYDIERQSQSVNVSGTILSLLSVECQRKASLVEVEKMEINDISGGYHPFQVEEHTSLPDHEQVESYEQVPEEEVGAGPGHVGELPQDVGSTRLAPVSAVISQEGPFQPVLAKYAPYQDGHSVRDFNPKHFKENPWAEWNPEKKIIECYSCKTFMPNNVQWSFSKWKNTERLALHGKSKLHKQGYLMWMAKKVSVSKKKSIASQVLAHHRENVEKTRNYVKVLIQSVGFMAQQNIAFRGHREDRSTMGDESAAVENRGNYLELLSLRSHDNEVLKNRLNSNSPKWIHSDFQNEMIEILGNKTRDKIIGDVKTEFCGEGMPYSIICDETSDNSRHEQLSLCLSYTGPDGIKKESFIMFIKVDSTDGESLYNHVSAALEKLGLDPENCYGLSMDGASNMSGKFRGLATRMKAISPRAVYIHCMGHQLNLVIKETLTGVKILKDTLGAVQSLYNFIEASPKRHSYFMNVQFGGDNNTEDNSFIRVLKSLSVTRWACHYEAVRAVSQEYLRIILTLSHIENDVSSDASTSSTARGLLKHILDQKFMFGIEILKVLLASTTKLSSELQSTKIDIRIARQKVTLVTTSLEMIRDSQHYDLLWEKTELVTARVQKLLETKELDYEVKLANLPRHSKFNGDVKTYYRAFFYEAAERIVAELNTRFNGSEHETLTKVANIIYDKNVEVSVFEEVSRTYDLDIEKLQSDHEMLQHFKVKLLVHVTFYT